MDSDEWSRYTVALATGLGSLSPGDTVILQVGRHYAQFASLPGRVRAEVSGNRANAAAPLLTDEQITRLRALGWRDPVPEYGRNHWCELPAPLSEADAQQLATMIVQALHDVLGYATPASVMYKAWNDATGEDLTLDWLTAA